ncbi:MAG: hypothetical protein K2N38_13700 [Oscillospiraceae bacterium]|nr:hypothetical protein [Oscillospiraceae bacterium]
MEIWREIYEAYCERNLNIQPPYPSAKEYIKTKKIEKEYGMIEEQIEEFENFLSDITTDAEKRGFYAGMKIALRLISE